MKIAHNNRVWGISFLPVTLFVTILLLTTSLCAGATYYFKKSGSNPWTTATNWSPTRTTPAVSDILVFDGSSTNHIATTVTGIPTQTFGLLSVLNGCTVTFTTSSAAGIILTIANSGLSFFVGSGSQLILAGNNSITTLLSLGVGTVNGDVIFGQGAAGTDHALSSATPNGIIFTSGATFQLSPTHNEPADDPFGSGTPNSVVFLSGATYYHGGTPTGPATFTVGDPFSLTPNASVSVFSSGSLFYMYDQSNLTFSGRTVGNLICNFSTANTVIGDKYTGTGQDSTWVIVGDLTMVTNGGSTGTANYTSASPVHIGGNLNIQSMPFSDMPPLKSDNIFEIDGSLIASTTFNSATSGSRIYLFGGSSTQNISLYGNNSVLSAVSVNNVYSGATNIVLGTNVAVVSTLFMATGNIITGSNTLSLGTSTSSVLTRTSGTIIGNLARYIPAGSSGVDFPVGTVNSFNDASVFFTGGGSTTAGVLTTTFTPSNPGTNGLPLTDGTLVLDTVNIAGCWTIHGNATTGSSITAGVALTANGFTFSGLTANAKIVYRPNSSSAWTLVGSAGSNVSTQIIRTGITDATPWGDYGIAESNLPPYAGFTTNTNSGNGPLTVNFTDTSLNLPTSWNWNFGDGVTTTIQNPSHTYAVVGAPTTYTVTLSVTNSFGTTTATGAITITETVPIVSFSVTPNNGNGPYTATFVDTSNYVTSSYTTFSWNFGDGVIIGFTTSTTTTHQYVAVSAPTTYTSYEIVSTPFGVSSTSQTVSVTESGLVVSFTINPNSGNGPYTATFVDTSNYATSSYTTFSWNFGDGVVTGFTASTTTTHQYVAVSAPTTYTSYEIVSTPFGVSSCSLTVIVTEAAPSAGFSGSPTSGAVPLTVNFTDGTNYPTSSAYTTWNWNFGDGSSTTIENPSHTYGTVGTYTVSLIVTTPFGTSTSVQANYITVASNVYTWSVASGSWQTATNWTPTRTTPAANDVLVFDGSIPGLSLVTATNILTQTIGEMEVINGSTVTFTSGGARTITAGTTGLALYVGTSSQLILGGANAIAISLPSVSVGTVNGDVVFAQTANVATLLSAATTNGIIFTNGASFQNAPTASVNNKDPFTSTSSTANSVVFQSGATYYSNGTKTGLANGLCGDPFSLPSPASVSVFQPGSMLYAWDIKNITFSGRTVGNVTFNQQTTARSFGSETTLSLYIANTCRFAGTGIKLLTYNGTGAVFIGGDLIIEASKYTGFVDGPTLTVPTNFEVQGNINAQGTFTPSSDPNRIYLVDGVNPQTITLNSGASVIPNLTVNNSSSGIVLGSTVSVSSTLAMTSGNINTGGNSLILGTSTIQTGVLNWTSGTIIGSFTRWVSKNTGAWAFPIGTVSTFNEVTVNFTTAPTTAGSLTASFTVGNPGTNGLPLVDGSLSLFTVSPSGYWTISTGNKFAGGTYTLTLEANGFNFASATADVRILQRNNGSSAWKLDGSAGTNSGVAIVRTGMSGPGNFGIGEPLISAGFIASPGSGVGPLNVNFMDTSVYNPTSWSWNFGDGGTSTTQNPQYTYASVAAPTTYIVMLVVSNAYGTSTATGTIFVTGLPPIAGFRASPTSGDGPLTVFFTDKSENSPGNWSWNFGDGASTTIENPQHTYASVGAPTTYTVILIETNAYGSSTATTTISVTEPAPNAGFSANVTSGDGPLTVIFTDTSVNLAGVSTTWSWTFGDGSTSTLENPTHTYASVTTPTTYTVKLVVTTPFGTSTFRKSNLISVTEPAPNAGFSANITSGNGPLTVIFTDTSANLAGVSTTWSWTFGDGSTSTLENPTHTYASVTAPTSYTVKLIVTTPFGSSTFTKSKLIFVTEPSPSIGFYGTPTVGNIPLAVHFTDTSGNNPYEWNWSFGDGGTSTTQNPIYTYNSATAPTEYNVQLIATNVYGASTGILNSYISITGPAPVAGFFATQTTGIGGTFVCNFRDTSANNPTSWSWNFGDGGTSIQKDPAHTYGYVGAATTYTITLVVSNGFGISTAIRANYIYIMGLAPITEFYASTTSGLGPLSVNFTDTSGNSPSAWAWSFGDGSSSNIQNPSHTYAKVTTPTLYTVQLIASNSYGTTTATYVNYIYVTETAVSPGFYATPTTGNGPLTVVFKDTSANNPTSWNWGFGDGGNSILENPTHVYAAVTSATSYSVQLIAGNVFGTTTVTYTNYISLTESAPNAGFYGTPTVGYGPMLVNFTDTSKNNPTSWTWNFGDGGTSNLQNPSHTYSQVQVPTLYSVQLVVSNSFGVSTSIRSNYISLEVSSTLPPYFPFIPSLKLFLAESLNTAFDMYDYNQGGPILSYALVTNFLGLTSLDTTSYGLQSTLVNQGGYFNSATSGTNVYTASNNSATVTLANKVKYSRYRIQKLPKVGLNVGESYTVNVLNYTLADGVPLPPPSFGFSDALQVSDSTLVSATWSGNTAVIITALAPNQNGPVYVYVIAATQPNQPYGEDIDREKIEVYTSLQSNGTFNSANDTTAYGLQLPPGRILLATSGWLTSYTDIAGTQANGIWSFHFNDADEGVEITPFPFNYIPMFGNQWYTMRMRVVADNSTNTHEAYLYGFSNPPAPGIATDIAGNVYFGIPAVWTWIETPMLVHADSTFGFPQIQFKAGQPGNVYLDEIQVINSAPTLVDANRYKTRYGYPYGYFTQQSDTVGWGEEGYPGAGGIAGTLISGGGLQVDFSGTTTGITEGIEWTADNGVAGAPATFAVNPMRQIGVRASISTLSGDFDSLGVILVAAYGVQTSGQVAIGLPGSNLIAAAGVGILLNGTYRTVGMPVNPYYQMQFGVRSDVPGVLQISNVDLDLDEDDPNYGDPDLFP